jgi:hypothetical protein
VRFNPGCACCGNQPCVACAGGLPPTMYLTLSSGTGGAACFNGTSFTMPFIGTGLWGSGSSRVSLTGCSSLGACWADALLSCVSANTVSVTVRLWNAATGGGQCGQLSGTVTINCSTFQGSTAGTYSAFSGVCTFQCDLLHAGDTSTMSIGP